MTTIESKVGELIVQVHPDEAALGAAAAAGAAAAIRSALSAKGQARVVIATGNSQYAFVDALADQDIDWSGVTVFHMDEYVGVDANHPASFQRWIRERIEERFQPRKVEYIRGHGDAEAEAARYEALLREESLDLVCMGIGENGHLAFNEPGTADFGDDRWARVITLTEESQRQQVGEGHFPDMASVPKTAISLTIPALLSAERVQVCAPESRKAKAVHEALTAEVSNACPATILRTRSNAILFLEPRSAELLSDELKHG
ncbi:MAG TPA: 6-phosphogluconolactonase [Microlunatus sp.]